MRVIHCRSSRILWIIMTGGFLFFNKATASKLEVLGNNLPPIQIEPDKSTGLNSIFVVSELNNSVLRYKTNSPQEVRVSYYSNLGAAYATPINSLTYDGEYIYINNPIGDVGYIFSENNSNEYFWIVDYSKHEYVPGALRISESGGCDETILDFNGSAGPINYFSINGRQLILSRELDLSYSSLEFDETTHQFIEKEYEKNIASINDKISISPPVTCSTEFLLQGDRFLDIWNKMKSINCFLSNPVAISVKTEAAEEDDQSDSSDSSNQISQDSDDLGGSAPATISFTSYLSDAVVHCEWQMAHDESFEDIIYRFTQQDLTYTFTSEGTVYVRFIGSNADGTCEAYGDTYTVNIGASELLIPNAFSPNGDGINDEWKVSYKSLIDFNCWIFDRHGHELFHFSDPKIGWNGTYNGKKVSPGVYYYVISAKGSDGKKYNRSGDINIVNSKGNNTTSNGE